MKTQRERFEAKILRSDYCWNWSGAIDLDGYGRVLYERKNTKASRVAYLLFCGAIPKGSHVLHSCDNRRCVNPAHLFLGSHVDNMIDMTNKGRRRIGTSFRRSDGLPSRAKLTKEAIARAFDLRKSGLAQSQIARELGVAQITVSKLLRGGTKYAR